VTSPSNSLLQGGERLLPTYARADVTIVRGEGARVWDTDGREYLDFGAGIAVVALGHLHPAPLAAVHEQLGRLWHASNLYRTEPAEELAARLSQRFGGGQAFFCNSGTEAVEAALKYARKATGKPGVVALDGGFHGRTLGSLSATGQPAKREPFAPLVPGVRFVPPNDMDALRDAVDADVGLVLLEPILGEGGVLPLKAEFVAAAAELPGLLCLDEVQTGVGRTGTFFAFEQLGIRPALVTLAKGLANGLPIGALLVADEVAGAFAPGDHGSTFGGNPIASSGFGAVGFSSAPASVCRPPTSSAHAASVGCSSSPPATMSCASRLPSRSMPRTSSERSRRSPSLSRPLRSSQVPSCNHRIFC